MSYIIGKNCIGCVDGGCLKVCVVNCIHGPINPNGMGLELESMNKEELKNAQLYINPKTCINCAACVPECPVNAIYRSETHAIKMGDEESVHKNYAFFGYEFK